MVGDRWRDVEAGAAAGCRPIFVDREYRERRPETGFRGKRHRTCLKRPPGSWSNHEVDRTARRQNLRRRSGCQRHARDVRQAVRQGTHDEPDADAQGRHQRLPRLARDVLAQIPDRPESRSRCSPTTSAEMERQAKEIASWGKNVNVKIPVTNTLGEPTHALVRRLSHAGVKLNVTAVFTLEQVRDIPSPSPRLSEARPRTSRSSPAESLTPASIRLPLPRWPRRASGARSHAAAHARRGADLGEPARAAERVPRRGRRLRHHHWSPTTCSRSSRTSARTSPRSRSRPSACSATTRSRPASSCDRVIIRALLLLGLASIGWFVFLKSEPAAVSHRRGVRAARTWPARPCCFPTSRRTWRTWSVWAVAPIS